MDTDNAKKVLLENGEKAVKYLRENKKGLIAMVSIVFASAIGAAIGSRIKKS